MNKKILASWDDIDFNLNGLGIAKFNNKFGIINYEMEILVPLKWKSVQFVYTYDNKITNLAIVKKNNYRVLLIDYKENKILSKEYKEIQETYEYNAFFCDNTRNKVLSFDGIEYLYENADIFLKSVKKNEKVSSNKYNYKQVFKQLKDTKYALVDENGAIITHFIFDSIEYWQQNEELICVVIDNKYFFIDNNGYVLLKDHSKSDMLLISQTDVRIDWDKVLHFKLIINMSGIFKVLIDNNWHLFLPDYSISEVYWEIHEKDVYLNGHRNIFSQKDFPFINGHRNFQYQKDFPFINRNIFEEAIIDKNGNFIKSWYFRGYRVMSNGLIVIRRTGLVGLFWSIDNRIEKRKHWIEAKDFNNQFIIVKLGKKQFIFVDNKGLEKDNFIFQDIKQVNENETMIKQNDKWKILNNPLEIHS